MDTYTDICHLTTGDALFWYISTERRCTNCWFINHNWFFTDLTGTLISPNLPICNVKMANCELFLSNGTNYYMLKDARFNPPNFHSTVNNNNTVELLNINATTWCIPKQQLTLYYFVIKTSFLLLFYWEKKTYFHGWRK